MSRARAAQRTRRRSRRRRSHRHAPLRFAGLLVLGLAVGPRAAPGEEPELVDPVFSSAVAEPDSSATLQAIEARLRAVKTMRASFSQSKRIRALRRPLKSAGTFLFSQARGICWRVEEPFASTFVITPERIISQDEGGKRVTVNAEAQPVLSGFTSLFLSLFRGDVGALREHFAIHFLGTEKEWTIGLVAHRSVRKRFVHNIVLRGDETLREVVVTEPTGDTTRIVFADATTAPDELSGTEERLFRE